MLAGRRGSRRCAGSETDIADNQAVDDHPVAVLSGRYARATFGAATAAVGRNLHVNGQPITIVGVVARPFLGPFADNPTDIWLSVAMQHALRFRGPASANNARADDPWMTQDNIAWLTAVVRIPADAALVRSALDAANQSGLRRQAEQGPRGRTGGGLRL